MHDVIPIEAEGSAQVDLSTSLEMTKAVITVVIKEK